MKQFLMCAALVAAFAAPSAAFGNRTPDSQRLERAKDLIADEQWERAIEQLKAAAADAKERKKDEALFWLAHSHHQARDLKAALQTIADLERRHASSPWVKPALSLRVEIAQKLRRNDVLWMTAAPPAPAPPPPPRTAPVPAPPRAGRPTPFPPPAPAATAPTPPPRPATFWMPTEGSAPDTSLRIQALGSLIHTDAHRVIPMLREIALDSASPRDASRAVFVLAQSGNPEAQTTVIQVAREGSEPVRIAAVKELGRFGGPTASAELVKLYEVSSERVKYQVVNSLADRAATSALLRIAETESNRRLQERAIVRIGQSGGHEQLRRFYATARPELKRPIVNGLFNARADTELIHIAQREQDTVIRQEVLTMLRLLGTDEARAFLETQAKK